MVWLYKNYFRVETHGIAKVPPGPLLIVSNHSGQLPLDAAMISTALLLEAEPPRIGRAMIERWAQTLPFIAPLFARIGQVVGTPENCRRLLAAGETILVFPEGVKGLNKTFDKSYQLQEFGLGFMRLALETRTPIVPVAVVGAEEQAPALWDFKAGAKLLGFPALPITFSIYERRRLKTSFAKAKRGRWCTWRSSTTRAWGRPSTTRSTCSAPRLCSVMPPSTV